MLLLSTIYLKFRGSSSTAIKITAVLIFLVCAIETCVVLFYSPELGEPLSVVNLIAGVLMVSYSFIKLGEAIDKAGG